MRQRNLRRRRRGHRRSHARNNFEFNPRLAQRPNLFSGTAKQKWVSAFQADDLQPKQCELNQQRVDFFLSDALFPAALANRAKLRALRNQPEDFRSDQFVVQHDIGCLQHSQRFQRKQLRIARPRAHQKYLTLHEVSPLAADAAAKAPRLANSCSSFRRASGSRSRENSCSRAVPSCSTHPAYSGPNCSSNSRRSRCANAGLSPAVEIANCSAPRRTTAGIIKIAMFRIVHRVAQDAAPPRLAEYSSIQIAGGSRGDYQEDAIKVAGLEGAPLPGDPARTSPLGNRVVGFWRDHANRRSRLQQAGNFRLGNAARAYHQAVAPGQLYKHGEQAAGLVCLVAAGLSLGHERRICVLICHKKTHRQSSAGGGR